MKATGEVMAIGRNIEESLLKAVRSLEIGVFHNEMTEAIEADDEKLYEKWLKHKMTDFSMYQKRFVAEFQSKKLLI